MQLWYNEAIAKGSDGADHMMGGSTTEESKTSGGKRGNQSARAEPASAGSKAFGGDGFKYPQLDFPATHDDLNSYNKGVRERIEKKYETLTKNVHFYLCYLFLETGDFRNAVKHGELVLRNYEGRLLKKTQFTVTQYLAEAYCMLEEHPRALELLDEVQAAMEEGRPRAQEDTKLTVEMLTDKLVHGEKLSTKTIVQMNKAAIMLCQGDLVAAKNQLNELLEDQNLRVVHTEASADGMIPDYLIKTLVYFLIVTKNHAMARHLTKYRRFVLDTGHQEQAPGGSGSTLGSGAAQLGPGGAEVLAAGGSQMAAGSESAEGAGSVAGGSGSGSVAGGSANQGAKKNSRKGNKTYISAIKSFS